MTTSNIQHHLIATEQLVQSFSALKKLNFETAWQIAPNLGANYNPTTSQTQFGFWLPEISEQNIPKEKVFLEILRSKQAILLEAASQAVDFQRFTFELVWWNDFAFVILEGVKAGSAITVGDFYNIIYTNANGELKRVFDPLASSLPFGAFAPAEVFDLKTMLANRKDADYFKNIKTDEQNRLLPPSNILQLHAHTATKAATIQGITTLFKNISIKRQQNAPLTAAEKAFANYDAIQLLPIMPQVDIENGTPFFEILSTTATSLSTQLTQHYIQNWGYDIVIAGAAAINPSLLATKRPDELLELIETLHHFHEHPKKIIFDIVYGHSDNQAQCILNKQFFLGSGMYGQEMNVQHPMVRAIMLESQRRISDYGVDGFRVDAAQDIVYKDVKGNKHYDNDYVGQMNALKARVQNTTYKPWMVFEDGRPWPQPDWNIATTYKEVHKMYPNAYQWGPLTFVNNKPLIFGFWIERFWRVQQIARTGEMWVTGGSNHDTYRGLAHLNPDATNYNSYLGSTLREVAFKAYNNPAARLLDHAFLPGIPMEFINASTDSPWGFVRNTDFQWGIKVMAEETYFLDWFVDADLYADDNYFQRLKSYGFKTYQQLSAFKTRLAHLVKLTDYQLDKIITGLQWFKDQFFVPDTVPQLRAIAKAYMEDAYEFCNVAHHIENANTDRIEFNYKLRAFRAAHPKLASNLQPSDIFQYWHSPEGAVIYWGLRTLSNQQILFIANMEGATARVPLSVFEAHLTNWKAFKQLLRTPKASIDRLDNIVLKDSEGVIWAREI